MVRFDTVGMRYGSGPEILRYVSFSLEPGSFHFLTGPSGAGKTSLLRLMYLARRPSRGLITLFGRDLATSPRESFPALRRRIGTVFQDFRLLDHLSALDNVALPLRVAGVREDQIQHHDSELLNWVRLAAHIHAKPATLSGVRLLFLLEVLIRMGTTVVIATHNESLVAQFDHPILRLRGGEMTVVRPYRRTGT